MHSGSTSPTLATTVEDPENVIRELQEKMKTLAD
jgi:hypothetical protein